MQLSKKQKLVPNFFSDFRNLDSILKIKKKKDGPHNWWIFELTDSDYLGNKNFLAIFLFFLFLHFKDLGSIFISFKKKTRTADVYLNLQASKELVR